MFSENFFLFAANDFANTLLRYFVLSLAPFWVLFKIFPEYFSKFRVNKNGRIQPRVELYYSIISFLVYCFADYFLLVLMTKWNVSKIYLEFGKYGLGHEVLSFIVLFIAQDFSFYVIHRLLHSKWPYRTIHKIHHLSKNTTPMASYLFHPVEAISMSLFFIILVCFFPVNVYVAGVYFTLSHLYNSYGHSGHDFNYSPDSFFAKWIHTSRRHSDHHLKNKGNYGLYTNVWDILFDTLDKK